MGLYSRENIESYINELIKHLNSLHIWNKLPSNPDDWRISTEVILDKASVEFKRKFVADMAKYLVEHNLIMTGKELAEIMNLNDIRTQYDTEYFGGRGTYTLIRNIWNYYYEQKDYIMAYYISRAFVDQNGKYPYE